MDYKLCIISNNIGISTFVEETFAMEVQTYSVVPYRLEEVTLEKLISLAPNIILLDTEINRRYALKLLADINALEQLKLVPVLVLVDDKSIIAECYDLGATDFLRIPFHKIELSVRVKSILSLFKLIDNIANQASELEKQSQILEEERKNLKKDKKKLDGLFTKIFPIEIAQQFKNKGKVDARQYRMVSILFTDFVGFSKLSVGLTPEEILKELNIFFTKFDRIVEKQHFKKIKTIGDAYMCVGGLPLRNKSNPIDACLVALRMQNFSKQYNKIRASRNLPLWQIRLGIHTGRVIAGMVGVSKLAYDIWGDAVNTASRMETACEPGKINISSETYKHVKEFFDCEYRGKIEVKNKGFIDMYYVHGLKPIYRKDNDPIVPNKLFDLLHSTY